MYKECQYQTRIIADYKECRQEYRPAWLRDQGQPTPGRTSRKPQQPHVFSITGNMKPSLIAQTICCALALGGCGGGTSNPPNTAEGFWVGTTGTGDTAVLVDLEVGQFFAVATSSAGDVIKEGLFGSIVGK